MNYYNEIKNELINNEVYKRAKDYSQYKIDLTTYYYVGKLLIEAQGGLDRNEYGNKLIKEYSKQLTEELGKGYSWRNLYNMRLFYIKFKEEHILQTVSAKLTWSHYTELLNIEDTNKLNYYINITEEYNLSVRELRSKIKNNEYERLSEDTKLKLVNKEENNIKDFIKNPILINNKYNYTEISEKILKQLILEDMDNFLTELGDGFCYIKNEYKIKVGNNYNYIDLLLFNYEYNCFVVIELKVTELKKEHIGQIEIYMNYIDKNIKKITQDKTIGIIICKKDNKFIMEYCSDPRIFTSNYIFN